MDDIRHRLLAGAPPVQPKDQEHHRTKIVTAWTLLKNNHRVVCTVHHHPLGVELRLDLDGELYRTEVIRCAASVPPLPANVID